MNIDNEILDVTIPPKQEFEIELTIETITKGKIRFYADEFEASSNYEYEPNNPPK